MAAFLKGLILLPVAILVVLLAVANRAPVLVSLDPFTAGDPQISFRLPLYALLFATAALGVVIGGVGSWFAGARVRRERREARREAERLRREAERLRAAPAASGDGAARGAYRLPALPRPAAAAPPAAASRA
jgi:uncharacterized integral membrane protein